jgi:hypothetical protein
MGSEKVKEEEIRKEFESQKKNSKHSSSSTSFTSNITAEKK